MNKRLITTSVLLAATIVVCFALPKPKYQSPDILGTLRIPQMMPNWQSRKMLFDERIRKDDRFNFLSDVFARLYTTRTNETLLFLIVDAGNFHHPKVCFSSSGFQMEELPDTEFVLKNKVFAAQTLLADKSDGGFVLMYWMVINQEQVNWTGQKFKELWHKLLGKEKIGLMGRLDIPVKNGNVKAAVRLGQRFIEDLSPRLSEEDSHYLFGK